MWIRFFEVFAIVVGLMFCYFGWRAINDINEIDDQREWEDAAYGSPGQSVGFLAIGAIVILVRVLLLFRLL